MDYLAVDSGTTNSRIWLMRDLEIVARRNVPVGVRNTAIDGNNRSLMEGIRQAVLELRYMNPGIAPRLAVAAGMITSNLGLHELTHVKAPAGIEELSSKIERRTFPEMEGISFYFIPGVRSGPSNADLNNVSDIDFVRGEETEVMGSLRNLALQGPLLYVHLGSHTKLIKVDASNRITGGTSTLAGEVLQFVQQQTVLRHSLPEKFVSSIDPDFLEQGWIYGRKHGLFRALYLIRVFDLASSYSQELLHSFFLGAILSEDFRCLETLMSNSLEERVILSGLPHLQTAWLYFLRKKKWPAQTLSAEETEKAFLRGLYEIFKGNPLLSED